MKLTTIIGCGNLNRKDDGVGVFVAQQLKLYVQQNNIELAQEENELKIFDAGTAGMEVMFQSRGSDELLLVDACKTDAEPGAIFEVPGEELISPHPKSSLNLHDFRWDHALYASKQIFKEKYPKKITVYLIEAEDISLGLELTDRVRSSALTVYKKICNSVPILAKNDKVFVNSNSQ